MKAFEIQSFGFDGLKLVDRPQPQPGPSQVLIKVRAWSINYRDLLVTLGHYNPKLPMPRVPLSDGVGEVVAVGANVKRVAVGDRVAGIFSQEWLDGPATKAKGRSALGGEVDGMAAEYVTLHQNGVVHVPAHLTDAEAASLPCAAVTAWNALFDQGNLRAGETVLLLGTGGVSLFALQFAVAAGAEVIITSKSDEKIERAIALGAQHGVNYRTHPEWDRQVLELTGGLGVDQTVEVGGAGTLPLSVRATRVGGRISLIGVLTGAGDFNPVNILMKSIHMHGIMVGSRAMFESMNRAIALHEIRPVIDRAFRFEELPDALRYMQSGSHFGKIVLEA